MSDGLDLELDRSRPIAASFPDRVKRFSDAGRFVQALPYARTSRPNDKMSVLREMKGTCSTKHALLAALASEQGLPHRLTLCFFEMSADTHPSVGPVLVAHGLRAILEAHCLLSSERGLLDCTGLTGDQPPDYHGFRTLDPDDLGAKVPLHKAALASWATQTCLRKSAERLWAAREACIAALQESGSGSG